MWTGVKTIVMAKFDLERFCQLVQEHQISIAYIPPPVVLALAKHPLVSKYDLSSLRFLNSGAAPLTKELVEGVWQRFKIGVKQGYGLSETSPVATCQMLDEFGKFMGSVGRLLPNMEAKIIGENGDEVKAGEVSSHPEPPAANWPA
jgi:acyl-CoA synthetase (AMP-forming)/AMP-acid ligase II